MSFLRRNLFTMLCALGAIAGVALAFTGWRSMPAVQEEMKKVAGVYGQLDSLASGGVNGRRLDKERQRIEVVKQDHEKVLANAVALQKVELLVPESLPHGQPLTRVEFRKIYGDRMRALQESLSGGRPATPQDIALMKDRIEDEEVARKQFAANPDSPGLRPAEITGPPRDAAGVLTKDGALLDATARAHLAAAQQIYCYIVRFGEDKANEKTVPGLDFDPAMIDTGTVEPPSPKQVWRAQVGYWIQKDVVDAINALNADAAKTAEAAGRHPWVGVMPVKEVISLRHFDGFITDIKDEYASAQPGNFESALPPATPVSVFTGTKNTPAFDVLQFTVKLVMDQRYINEFVERLCNNRFYTPLRISYHAMPVNRNMIGKIYGSGPAAMVVIDFEWVLLGEVYRRYMPDEVREAATIQCRPQDECEKAE